VGGGAEYELLDSIQLLFLPPTLELLLLGYPLVAGGTHAPLAQLIEEYAHLLLGLVAQLASKVPLCLEFVQNPRRAALQIGLHLSGVHRRKGVSPLACHWLKGPFFSLFQ